MGIFRELLSIKSFRETKAEMAVFRQRSVLAQAVSQEEQAQSTLNDFRIMAIERERAMYSDLCARTVRLRDIEDVQQTVAQLRTQEHEHEKTLTQAETQRKKEAEELDERKVVHADASRVKEKFIELARVHAVEKLLEIERKEDLELEEAAELRRDRVDWEERPEEEETE